MWQSRMPTYLSTVYCSDTVHPLESLQSSDDSYAHCLRCQWHWKRFFGRFLSHKVSHIVSRRQLFRGRGQMHTNWFLAMQTIMLDMLTLSKKTSRRLGIMLNCHSLHVKQKFRIWTRLSARTKSCVGRMQKWKDCHQRKGKRLLWSGTRNKRTESFHSWGVQPIRISYSFSIGYSLLIVCETNSPSTSKSVLGLCMPFTLWKVYVIFMLWCNSKF